LNRFLAKPLVYTTLKGGYGGKQVVIACSETNWIYVLDAVNGTIYNRRQLHRPFLVSDIACNDINPQVGITGTPVIDPQTDIMYLYSKTYIGNANGYQNGVYYFHALDVNTLIDVYPPVNVNGGPANNDPNKGIFFTGSTVLQRASLTLINGAVWAGFGGHCDLVSLISCFLLERLLLIVKVQLHRLGHWSRCANRKYTPEIFYRGDMTLCSLRALKLIGSRLDHSYQLRTEPTTIKQVEVELVYGNLV
jgi:hypothetical protein